jgi:MFS family permease
MTPPAVALRRRVGRVARGLWSDGRGWILVAISFGQLLMLGVRVTFPTLLPQIKAEFLLSNTTAGILLSVLWVSFASAQLPGGVLSDWIGERNTLVASAAGAVCAVAVIVLSPDLLVFGLGLVLLGFATGVFATPRLTVLSDIYPERAGTAMGINASVGNFGNTIMPLVATVVAGVFAWRAGIGITLPGFALLAVALWLVVPVRTSAEIRDDGTGSRRRLVGRVVAASTDRPVLVATAGMILIGFVWQAYTSFLPTYIVEVKGLPQSTAAVALGAFFVTGGVVQPFIGNVADRYDERRVLVGVSVITGAAIAAFPLVDSGPVLVGLSAVVGLKLAYWPIVFAYVTRALPEDIQGSGFGLLRTVFLYVGATGPIVIGALADVDLFDESFLLLAGLLGVAAVVSGLLPGTNR